MNYRLYIFTITDMSSNYWKKCRYICEYHYEEAFQRYLNLLEMHYYHLFYLFYYWLLSVLNICWEYSQNYWQTLIIDLK